MPKTIPLRATLRVERQSIVIHRPRRLVEDMLMKRLPIETRYFWPIQCPICRDPDPMHDFFRRCDSVLRGQAVEHAELVVGAKETPGIALRAIRLEGKRCEGRCFLSHVLSWHCADRT